MSVDMSYVIADPEMMAAAASNPASIGSNVSVAHMVGAARTTSVIPAAAADEVSAAIANLMSTHARALQAMAQSASTFNQQFTHNVNAAAPRIPAPSPESPRS